MVIQTTDGFKGQVKFLYIFGTIALFVLLIAAVNYVKSDLKLINQRTIIGQPVPTPDIPDVGFILFDRREKRFCHEYLVEEFQKDSGLDLRKDPLALQRLKDALERSALSVP